MTDIHSLLLKVAELFPTPWYSFAKDKVCLQAIMSEAKGDNYYITPRPEMDPRL